MTDKDIKETPWNQIGINTFRYKLDNGYLYMYHSYDKISICFVPDVQNGYNSELVNRLNSLEAAFICFKQDKDSFLNIIERIEKLDQHKNYQIDENRKISRRIDEIENGINGTKELWININNLKGKKIECDHDWGNTLLLSDPPQMKCVKCKYIIYLPKAIYTTTDETVFKQKRYKPLDNKYKVE